MGAGREPAPHPEGIAALAPRPDLTRSADDPYRTGAHRYWHLSRPSPELDEALADGWIRPPGVALDLGCGLGVEVGRLTAAGFRALGVDRSLVAAAGASAAYPEASFVGADVRSLPVRTGTVDVLVDRGCLHYLAPADRGRYEAEARRVLRPGGRLLLRACLFSHGRRNDLEEDVLEGLFAAWGILRMERRPIPADDRDMLTIVVRLERAKRAEPARAFAAVAERPAALYRSGTR